VKVFFDNCVSPALASTLDGFIRHSGHEARHISDLSCGRHAPDVEWIEMLAHDPAVWIVVTGDERISKNRAERQAFRAAGLSGFALHRAYQKTPLHQCASFLLWRWPEMESLTRLVGGPVLYELPMNRTAKIKALPI
jgi:hypothetical protein